MDVANGTSKARILVVDDQEEMRTALRETLRRLGYEVEAVSGGEEAIRRFACGDFALVISDVCMPALNGMGVLEGVKKTSPVTPVVLVTAYGTVDSAVEAMKKGAFDYVLKPFSIESLELIVRAALQDGRAACSGNGGKEDEAPKRREIITMDPSMKRVLSIAKSVASSKASILIHGESGTGKELLARYIHKNSSRRDGPFVAVNCAAMPEGLLESELFGHEKGAFTGAMKRKPGKFHIASGGTLLLDEIGEMNLALQAKLLRVIQEGEIDVVGGTHPIPVDVRLVSTTNKDLKRAIDEGKFREDLFYRLNVIPIHLPPLREREEDIRLLARHFVEKHGALNGGRPVNISEEAMDILMAAEWRGNVRELENVIERGVLLAQGDVLAAEHLFLDEAPQRDEEDILNGPVTMREMEKHLIFKTLREMGGNRTRAAQVLGISVRTLRNKLNEYKALSEA